MLDDGQDVLAYVRGLARPAALAPASHWRTWDWWHPGAERRDCDPGSETFRALWAGSLVEVIVPRRP